MRKIKKLPKNSGAKSKHFIENLKTIQKCIKALKNSFFARKPKSKMVDFFFFGPPEPSSASQHYIFIPFILNIVIAIIYHYFQSCTISKPFYVKIINVGLILSPF